MKLAGHTSITMKWDYKSAEDIIDVYERYIGTNANDVKTIFIPERILFQTITKTIIGYVSKV